MTADGDPTSSNFDADSTRRLRVLLADDHPAMLALTADALADECLVVGWRWIRTPR